MNERKFVKNDQAFSCLNCGQEVQALQYTSRNHCPKCLYSLHVDNNPGDRSNECQGLMKPIGIEVTGKKGYVIVHQCLKCGEIKKNKAADSAKQQPDDVEEIIRISAHHENK